MNAIWNLSVLERPPYTTWQISLLDAKRNGIDINRFKAALTTATNDLKSMSDLHLNAAVLSRLIYRMKSKFRNDKGLKYMAKLNKALLNYYNMSLEKEYTTLQSDLRLEDKSYVLPSKQNVEYMLVRTLGFAKLMTRVEEISRYTSHFLKARIKLGHAWTVALIAYATTSRIWFHVRNAIRKCCKWYNELYQCAEQFQYVGTKLWLPTDQSLPHDLKSWLCLDWLDADITDGGKLQIWQKIFEKPLTEVYKETETNFIVSDEEIDASELIQKEIASTNNILEDKPTSNTDITDIGEVIDRKTLKINLASDSPKTMKRKAMDTSNRNNLKEPKRKKRKRNKRK
ncbi:hypothetical protein PUN28_001792 [Cardiocondyla obscurior]|uniref:Nucleolus and neural progenitor protein-like N-terminal domain-containing protein n=1 Tax=Cardiocondyla obscurior TaxID=286306 RepID=A0AAW2GRC5_9HYME